MQDNRDDLYLNLRDAGIGEDVIGTQKEFKDFVTNEQNTRDLYNNLRDSGIGEDIIGSEDDFYNFVAPDFSSQKDKAANTNSTQQKPFTQQEYDNLSPVAQEVAKGVGVAPKFDTQGTAQKIKEQLGGAKERTQFVPEASNVVMATPTADALKKYPFLKADEAVPFNRETGEPLYTWVDENGKPLSQRDIDIRTAKQEITGEREYMQKAPAAPELPDATANAVKLDGSITDFVDNQMRAKYGDNYLNELFKTSDGREVSGTDYLAELSQGLYDGLVKDVNDARIQYIDADDEQKNQIVTALADKYKGLVSRDTIESNMTDEQLQAEAKDARRRKERQQLDEAYNNAYSQRAAVMGENMAKAQEDYNNASWLDKLFGGSPVQRAYWMNQNDNRIKIADTQINLVLDAKRVLDTGKAYDDGESWSGRFVRGMRDAMKDTGLYDGGIEEMNDLRNVKFALDAYESGNATNEQKDLLDTYALLQTITGENSDALGRMYSAGQTTVQAIPFMLQMYINPIGSLGQSTAKAATQFALKQFGRSMMSKYMKRLLATSFKAGGRITGDMLAASLPAMTFGAPAIGADMYDRLIGNVKGVTDNEGNIEYSSREGQEKSKAAALAKSIGSNYFKYQSEMVGEYFKPFTNILSAGIGKATEKIGLGQINDLIANLSNKNFYRSFSDFAKRTQWQGTIGEYLEEVVNNAENALFIGDMDFSTGPNGVFNKDVNIDTFLGVAAMTGFMSSLKTADYIRTRGRIKDNLDNAYNNGLSLFGVDEWQKISDELDNIDENNAAKTVKRLVNSVDDNDMKQAIANYAAASAMNHGFNIGDLKNNIEEASDNIVNGKVPRSAIPGFDALSPDEQQNVHDDGMIHSAILYPITENGGNAEQVFIVKGNVALNNDGSIDIKNSSDAIYYKGSDGKIHQVAPNKILAADVPVSVEDYIAMKSETAETAALENEGTQTNTYSPGEVVNINVNGNNYEATVNSLDGNGNIMVYYQDENGIDRPATFTTEQLDAFNAPQSIEQPVEAQQPAQAVEPEQPVESNTEQVQPANAEGTAQAQQEQPAQQSIPTDEEGNPLYYNAPIEATINDLYDGSLNDEEIQGFIDANIQDAQKKYDSIQKKAPKIGTNKAKYLEQKREWQTNVDEAKRILDYWQSVDNYRKEQTHTTDADIQSAQAELSGDNARAEFDEYNDNGGVNNAVSVASDFIRGAKITPDSFKAETGYGTSEQQKFVGMIASAENGGKSIDRLAEELVSYDNAELNGVTFNGDTSVAKDAILEALQGAGTRGELAVNNTAEQERYVNARRAELDAQYMEAYGMTYQDYLAYEEQKLPEMLRKYANFDEVEFYNLYADEIEQSLNARINEQENDTTGEEPRTGGGNEVLPGEGIGNARGSEGSTEQGAEVPAGVQGTVEDGTVPERTSEDRQEGRSVPDRTEEVESATEGLTSEDADNLLSAMEARAEVAPDIELTPTNWVEQFGEDGMVDTPIGKVKMGENQIAKLFTKGRSSQFGMIRPTLTNPDVIVEVPSSTDIANNVERPTSLLFIKTFLKNDGSKVYYFKSVTVKKDGLEVSVSSHLDRKKRVEDALRKGKLQYRFDGGAQTEHRPADVSVTTPLAGQGASSKGNATIGDQSVSDMENGTLVSPQLASSGSKDTQTSANEQTVSEKIAQEEAKVEQNPTEAQKEAKQSEQSLSNEAHEIFSDLMSKSAHQVEIDDENVTETDNTLYAPIKVDGKDTSLSLYQEEPAHSSGEPIVGVSFYRDGMTYQEAADLSDAYNQYVGEKVCTDGSDELAINFGSIDEAVRFEEWLNDNGGVLFREAEDDSTHKQRQLEIINDTNPMLDDYHTGIRSEDDIKTMREAIEEARSEAEKYGDETWSAYPDITNEMLDEALRSGKITVYSSKPIVNGNFVTPSRMQASDYAGGGRIYSKTVNIDDVAWINTDEGQYANTDNDANENIRFRFIGEQGAANLDAAEEATTRLDNLATARRMEQAYIDKKARIDKLRDSKPVEITGEEYKGKYDLNRDSAQDFILKNLRGEYTIADTGEKVTISKVGAKKVTSHSMGNNAHLKSIVAIPQLLKNAIFIEEVPNEKENGKYDSYRYYVTGLKIGNEDYTVRLTIGVKNGKYYYDHYLTEIEKGNLIEIANGFTPTGDAPVPSYTNSKDTRLISLLQTNDRENARKIKIATGWERGADGQWRYETPDFEYYPNGDARQDDKYKESDWYKELYDLEERLFNGETLTDEETRRFDELAARENEIRDNDKNTEHVYLDDYVKDDELFKAYPELKQTRVDFVDIPNAEYSAKYNEQENRITVNTAKSMDNKSVLAHEIQHAIQRIEGFANGSNTDNYRNMPTSENVISDIVTATDGRLLEDGGFDNTPQGIFDALNRKTTYGTILRDYNDELDTVAQKYGYDNIFDLVNDIDKFKSSVQMYLSESGEVEARNVQTRLDMSPEERRQSLAEETEDVAREDQTFLQDALGTSESRANEDIDAAVSDIAGKLNIGVRVAHSIDEVNNDSARRAIEQGRGIQGFYDTRTGEIVVYAPNAVDAEDAVRTVLHEGVAHYGLRQLVGEENFGTFLDNIYNNVSDELKQQIDAKAREHNWSARVATEEYLASLAEDTNFEQARNSGIWQKIKDFFTDLLTKAGIHLANPLTDNELRYILWRSYENLKEPGRYRSIIGEARDMSKQRDLNVGNYKTANSSVPNVADKANEPDVPNTPELDEENRRFNEELDVLTEENADKVALSLGRPSAILRAAGVEDKSMKLYGNKVIKKMKKHGFMLDELRNLPKAVADPIAVFNNYQRDGNRSILTELRTSNGNFLVTVDLGKDADIDFNIVTSVFGKGDNNIIYWINKGYATYINKEKAQEFLFHQSAPIAATAANSELISAANVVKNFENPSVESENVDEDILYRMAEDAENDLRKNWQEEYDRRTTGAGFNFTEASQDDMRSVKMLQKTVAEETGRPITANEDADALQNRLSSTNHIEEGYYEYNYFRPIIKAVANLVKMGASYNDKGRDIIKADKDVLKYIIAKSGLERNAKFRERDAEAELQRIISPMEDKINNGFMDKDEREAMRKRVELEKAKYNGVKETLGEENANKWYDKERKKLDTLKANNNIKIKDYDKRVAKLDTEYNYGWKTTFNRDYSGLTELFGKDDFDVKAQEYVERFEGDFKDLTGELWKTINNATKATLRKAYESGLISRKQYEDTRDMFNYYVPLRSWSNDSASEMYNYRKDDSGRPGKLLKHAFGRTSLADNPLAMIATMAQSTIMQGNKNKVKQRLYNLAVSHNTSLLSVDRQWYENKGTDDNPKWERAYPELNGEMGAEEVAAALENFEQRMQQLKEQGRARRNRQGLTLAYHTTRNESLQHRVSVSIGGREYNIYVNGNPRAAQALNGELRDDESKGVIAAVHRWLSKVYTSHNPEFTVGNYQRDSGLAAAIVAATEDKDYQLPWAKNMALFNPFTSGLYLNALINGTIKGKNDLGTAYNAISNGINKTLKNGTVEQYMHEFLFNGGETGFTNVLTVDQYKKKMRRDIKDINTMITPRKAQKAVSAWMERCNRVFEDATRFATYVTSREQGRDVNRSIRDAKEISLNFNTRGADGLKNDSIFHKFFRGLRRWYIFTNPNIQALEKVGRAFATNPKRSALYLAGIPVLLGYSIAKLIQVGLDGDDDDERVKAYKDLPEWIRRSNICIPVGGTKFVTVPLSYELRISYGLGEMLWEMEQGDITPDKAALEIATQLSDLLPVSLASGSVYHNLAPSGLAPIVDVAINENYMGIPIWSENGFNENMPAYSKAFAGTEKWLVKSAEVANSLIPDPRLKDSPTPDKYTPGLFNVNPGMIEHLLDNYFGGWFTFPMKAKRFVQGYMLGDEDVKDIRNIPFMSRNLKDSKTGSMLNRSQGDRYWIYMNEYELNDQRRRGYTKEAEHGVPEFIKKITELYDSPGGQRMMIIKGYKKTFDKIDRRISEIDEFGSPDGKDKAEREELKNASDSLKSEMVDILDGITNGTIMFKEGKIVRMPEPFENN